MSCQLFFPASCGELDSVISKRVVVLLDSEKCCSQCFLDMEFAAIVESIESKKKECTE